MSKYTLPHFGEIDTTKLEEYYDTEIEFNEEEISLDLNFEDESIDTNKLDAIKKMIESLSNYDKQNKKFIEEDYKDEKQDTVRTYIEHHLEEIDEDELSEIIDVSNKSVKKEIQMMKALHLVRVGFYPHGEEIFATFDYSLDQDITNYLVVINLDENGKLVYMTMES